MRIFGLLFGLVLFVCVIVCVALLMFLFDLCLLFFFADLLEGLLFKFVCGLIVFLDKDLVLSLYY